MDEGTHTVPNLGVINPKEVGHHAKHDLRDDVDLARVAALLDHCIEVARGIGKRPPKRPFRLLRQSLALRRNVLSRDPFAVPFNNDINKSLPTYDMVKHLSEFGVCLTKYCGSDAFTKQNVRLGAVIVKPIIELLDC